ncbi:glycosyltransferase family 2 protein [soil metagenome]
MSTLALVAFWGSSALLAWVYFGYPLLALAFARLRPLRLRDDVPRASLVTVGVAVHDAEELIEGRLRDILAQESDCRLEVIVASDGSTDATPAIVGRISQADPRVRLVELPRVGQSAAQAAIFDAAGGEVVVLTDAETRFAPAFLRALLAPFADERVGCTTGVLRWRYERESDTAQHEGLYWRYEQAVRRWESRAGWLAAATGALLAVRRSIYRPAPAHASLDQMLPLLARATGMFVVAVPDAVGTDRGTSSAAEQFASRVRIATQGIEANLRMAARITPWRSPGTATAIWSHKILRWMTPILVLAAAVAAIVLIALGEGAYLLPATAIGAFLLVALVGLLARRLGRPLPLVTFPLTVMLVNAAFALGWINVLLGRRIGRW